MSRPSCFRAVFFAPALALAVSGLTACSGNTDSADIPSVANPLDSEENAVVASLNTLRSSLGLGGVSACNSLNSSASSHSDDLRDNPTVPLGMPGSDGSSVRTRACAAGYKPACTATAAMGEVVASGYPSGDTTLDGWATDPVAGPIIKGASFIVVGVGRSQAPSMYIWTMDLGSAEDPSCDGG